MAQENMIEAVGLTKAYGETQALAGVDLSVQSGTVLGCSVLTVPARPPWSAFSPPWRFLTPVKPA